MGDVTRLSHALPLSQDINQALTELNSANGGRDAVFQAKSRQPSS
jgi:hypothetical protein